MEARSYRYTIFRMLRQLHDIEKLRRIYIIVQYIFEKLGDSARKEVQAVVHRLYMRR